MEDRGSLFKFTDDCDSPVLARRPSVRYFRCPTLAPEKYTSWSCWWDLSPAGSLWLGKAVRGDNPSVLLFPSISPTHGKCLIFALPNGGMVGGSYFASLSFPC